MSVRVLRGDAANLSYLPDSSVDLIVTSPPYFALRDYKDSQGSLTGQIGAEPTPAEFLEALWECAREWWRVLSPSGSLWVNLGDKYNSAASGQQSGSLDGGDAAKRTNGRGNTASGHRKKSLLGLPWRFAIGMTDGKGDPDGTGWILRAEVIWAKPNGLPESVKDRVRRSHEQWFHFTKSERYYSAVDLIREPHAEATTKDKRRQDGAITATMPHGTAYARQGKAAPGEKSIPLNALGKLPGSVWTIATEPLKVPEELGVEHFAAFPTEWPRRIILGWAPTRGVCVTCNEGLRPVGDVWACACNEPILTPTGRRTGDDPSKTTGRAGFNRPRSNDEGTSTTTRWEHAHWAEELRQSPHRHRIERLAAWLYGPHAFAHYLRTDSSGARPIPIAFREALLRRGWLSPVPEMADRVTRPAVVLDPFGGTGTTAAVAKALGCIGISNDLSADYNRLARWRCRGDGYQTVLKKVTTRTPKR